MKLTKFFSIAAVAAAMSVTAAQAGDIPVGTGGEKGNYYGMTVDVADFCGDQLGTDRRGNANKLVPVPSGGSVVNVNGIINKEFYAGVTQEDVLQYLAKRNPKVNQNNLRIIASMHLETVHVLIPKNWEPQKQGGLFSSFKSLFKGGDEAVSIDINMLKGQTVGAWGGSVISAEALGYFLDTDKSDDKSFFNVQEYKEAPKTLDKPFIIVGGVPYKPVAEYLSTGAYHLVGLNHAAIVAQAPFYMKSAATYSGKTVETIGVRAHLVGKASNKESRNAPMVSLASCINNNLADLADDMDTNPNWQSVYDFDEAGVSTNWSYFKF